MASTGTPLRTTRQRQVILEELRKLRCHPTADELYEYVRQRLPRISMGTIYRNLEVLSDKGLVLRLAPENPQMRFDGVTSPHYHIRCVRCGRVDDVFVEPFDKVEAVVADATDYEVRSHRLEFQGLCPTCKRQPPEAGSSEAPGAAKETA